MYLEKSIGKKILYRVVLLWTPEQGAHSSTRCQCLRVYPLSHAFSLFPPLPLSLLLQFLAVLLLLLSQLLLFPLLISVRATEKRKALPFLTILEL